MRGEIEPALLGPAKPRLNLAHDLLDQDWICGANQRDACRHSCQTSDGGTYL